jgi:hypothetical protein
MRGKEGFDGLQVGAIGNGSAAVALDVNLIDFDLAFIFWTTETGM